MITLDKDHIYRVDGIVKPGVSEILAAANIIDARWYTEDACQRGVYVHKAVEIYHKYGLNFDSLDSVIVPYVDAYLDWLKTTEFKPILVERKTHEPIYDYCGTPDLVGYLRGVLTLIDIKTGVPSAWTALQTAAYVRAVGKQVENKPIVARYALQLKPNGKWSMKPYRNSKDAGVFLSALAVYNWKEGRI